MAKKSIVDKILAGFERKEPKNPVGRPRKKPLPPPPPPKPQKPKSFKDGRPSLLPDKAWEHIRERHLRGELVQDLAKEFKVSESAVYDHVSKANKKIKCAAEKILEADEIMQTLPLSQKSSVINLVEELRAVSVHLALAAKYGASTAHRTAALANEEAEKLDVANSDKENVPIMQRVSRYMALSNEAAKIGIGLIAMTKSGVPDNLQPEKEIKQEKLSNDPVEASKAYQLLINGR